MRKFNYLTNDVVFSKGYFKYQSYFLIIPKIEGEYFYIPFEGKRDPLIFQLRGNFLVGEITLEVVSPTIYGLEDFEYEDYNPNYIYDMLVLTYDSDNTIVDYLGAWTEEVYL